MLVVEDEPNIRELVCLHLGHEGYVCEGVGDGQNALKRADADRFDLMVVDVMIPGLDGLSLCRAIRNGRVNHDVPILILTARREEADKVIGLESGADDYLTKPFGVRELVARARALLRRPRQLAGAGPAEVRDVIAVHGIEVDVPKRRVRVNGADVELMPRRTRPGSPAVDAPAGNGWLLGRLGGRFQLLAINATVPKTLSVDGIGVEVIAIPDVTPELRDRYLGPRPSAVYLLRPDQHVLARWETYDGSAVRAAVNRAAGRG